MREQENVENRGEWGEEKRGERTRECGEQRTGENGKKGGGERTGEWGEESRDVLPSVSHALFAVPFLRLKKLKVLRITRFISY